MEEKACQDVLAVLSESHLAIEARRFSELHDLSNKIMHCISIYQDKVLLDVAVAIYSLDKLLEDDKFQRRKEMPAFIETVVLLLKDAELLMKKRTFSKFDKTIRALLSEIDKFSKKVRVYTQDVLDYARAKKGSKLYEHGLSLGTAAELTGVSKWELMRATGGVAHEEVLPVSEKRIRLVRKIFKLGSGK
jgi:hypothetical protein